MAFRKLRSFSGNSSQMRTRTARLERIGCPDSAAAFGVVGARSIRMIMPKRWLDLQRRNSIGGQLPVCTDTGARRNISSSRYGRPDCPEGEDGRGEIHGTRIRPDHRGRGGPRWPRATAGNRLPGWSDQGGYRAEDHNAAGCRVSRLCRDCLPRQARCIALRIVLREAGNSEAANHCGTMQWVLNRVGD